MERLVSKRVVFARMFAVVCVVALFAAPSFAQGRRRPGTGGAGGAAQAGGFPGPTGSARTVELRPYEEVVTKDAKTQEGMFKVHRIGDRVLWEIPANLLGRDMLWETTIA